MFANEATFARRDRNRDYDHICSTVCHLGDDVDLCCMVLVDRPESRHPKTLTEKDRVAPLAWHFSARLQELLGVAGEDANQRRWVPGGLKAAGVVKFRFLTYPD